MKQNSKSQAGTEVQQSDAVETSSVSPTCTKPLVVCSQTSVSKLSDMKKIWLSDEYLKKRKQSYDEIFKTLVEGSPLP